MRTALARQLTSEDLITLGRRVCQKITDTEAPMGTWRAERRKWRKRADGDYSDRKTKDDRDIFSKEHVPLEFITSVAEFMVARTCDDLMGTDPFFAAIPQGDKANDSDLASEIERHARYKLRQARFKPLAKQAVDNGYHVGEGIMKCTWCLDKDQFEELAQVLVGPDAQPIVCETGDYIHETDPSYLLPDGSMVFAKQPIEEIPEGAQFAQQEGDPLPVLMTEEGPVVDENGEPWHEHDVKQVGDVQVLCRGDLYTGTDFKEVALKAENVMYEGLEMRLVNHDDFIAPLNVPDLKKADFVGFRMSLKRSYLREKYGLTKEMEQRIGQGDHDPKDAASAPIDHLHEGTTKDHEELTDDRDNDPMYKCVEGYAKMLIKGRIRRICFLVEEESQTIIAIDYWANVTPGGVLPVFAVVPKPVKDRWWGRSYHDIYESEADFVDRTFSAIVYRNRAHANPMKFIKTRAFKDKTISVFEPGKWYEIDENWIDEDGKGPIRSYELPDLDSRTIWIFEMVIQMAQVRSGVTGAAQGAIANLPANGTATGVQSIMMSGSVLHKQPMEACKDGLEDGLGLLLKILYANQNRDETIAYLEGDATQVLKLNAKSVKDLDLDVQLILTKMHEQELLDAAKAAIEAIQSYIGTPESEKDSVRPLFVQVLKSLKIANPDAIVRKAIPPEQMGTGSEPPSVSLNYKDTPPDVRRQLEAQAGLEPSQMPDNEMVEQAAQAAQEPAAPPEQEAPPLPENAA